jgi:hypothetical protein
MQVTIPDTTWPNTIQVDLFCFFCSFSCSRLASSSFLCWESGPSQTFFPCPGPSFGFSLGQGPFGYLESCKKSLRIS